MSETIDARINDIMPPMKGKAFRTTTWRRFSRGMSFTEILDACHESAGNIPEYANIDLSLVADVVRGRINHYLTTKAMTVEQVAGKCSQTPSVIREIIAGGESFSHLAKAVDDNSRPTRKPAKAQKPKKSKKAKAVRINDEAADQVIVTIQAILDGNIDQSHTDIVLRGLARFAHEQRLPFADKIETGIALIGKVPVDIALLGILDIASE